MGTAQHSTAKRRAEQGRTARHTEVAVGNNILLLQAHMHAFPKTLSTPAAGHCRHRLALYPAADGGAAPTVK